MQQLDPIKLPRGLIGAEEPRTHFGHVMHDLGLEIVSGRYPENSILPGDGELLDRFGVSRTVLREAFKTLSAKGLIQAKAKVGTRVRDRRHWNLFDPHILQWHVQTGVDVAFLLSLSEMRQALEPAAAGLAAERRSDEQVAALYQCVEGMSQAKNSGSEFVENDLRFHLIVAEASGNPFMRSVSSLIATALGITFTISSPLPDAEKHARTVARHRAIAEAIEARDGEAAREAMKAVIHEGVDRVLSVAPRKNR